MENTTQTSQKNRRLPIASRPGCITRIVLGAAIAATTLCSTANPLFAQPVRTATRTRYVDDLVKRLMDSENERRAILNSTVPDYSYDRDASSRLTAPTREMRQLLRLLDDFADESSNLTSALDDERNRLPSVRPYFSEALKLRASSYLLSQRAAKINDHRAIVRDYSRIDQDFRLLSYNLRQVRGLSRNVARPVVRMEQIDKEITDLLAIAPQIDRDALLQKTATLTSSVQHLLDEIEIEIDRTTDSRRLLVEGRRVRQQAGYVSNTISDHSDRKTVVAEFQQFLTLWTSFESQLRPFNNRYLERSLRRIDAVNHDIKELLWIPHQVDRTELIYRTNTLKRNVDTFFERAPLKLLITLDNNSNVLPVSNEFYGVCQHFADCVEEKQTHNELIEAFRYVEDSWKGFHATFDLLDSQKARLVLNDIEAGIRSLREELKINDSFDRKSAVELAAAVDNLAHHLSDDIDRWTANRNTALARQARRDTATFASAVRQLHTDTVNGRPVDDLARKCESVFTQWGKLHAYIPRADVKDREHLQRVSSRLTPYLVDLRTMLAAYQ